MNLKLGERILITYPSDEIDDEDMRVAIGQNRDVDVIVIWRDPGTRLTKRELLAAGTRCLANELSVTPEDLKRRAAAVTRARARAQEGKGRRPRS